MSVNVGIIWGTRKKPSEGEQSRGRRWGQTPELQVPDEGVVGKAMPAVLRNSLRKQLSIRLSRRGGWKKRKGSRVHRRGMREGSKCGHQADARDGRRPGWPLHP